VFQYDILPKYGFIIKYYKDKIETSSVNTCDTFNIYYNNNNELLPALSYLINNIPELNYEVDYVKSETLFLIADYNSIFLNESTKRKDIDPLDYRIISMAGIYSKFWIQIIQSFIKTFDIKCNLYERYMSSFGSPTWEINFRKNKAVVLNAYIKADRIDISLKLTTEQINEALKLKDSLLPYIFQNLEAALSKKGKFIDIKIESQQEVDSIFEIINNI
ncbi:MAG: hypothetical protein K0S55_2070, partial [Clostridia bacterium]|nr:hypothetical protein [Clostridia bacterium]